MDITYRETNYFSSLILDYIAQKPLLASFYQFKPEWDSFQQSIDQESKNPCDRKLLTDVLRRQYKGIETPSRVSSNIDLLYRESTYVITTAHQLNIFTGPLYIPYKILSAINLAESLKERYPDRDFVPVYWMGSEDHDFDEICGLSLYGRTLKWTRPGEGATGRMNPGGLVELCDEMGKITNNEAFSSEWIELLKTAYGNHSTLSQATQFLINKLFGEFGLVVIDPDDRDLKSLFRETMLDDLLHHSSHRNVEAVNRDLGENYNIQATPREINLFYLRDNYRDRLVYDDSRGIYQALNSEWEFDEQQITDELNNFPERFSPNVILRPMYQQKILPSLAYIGGGGEISYWMELIKAFNHQNINFPILLLRKSLLLLDEKSTVKLAKLNISPPQLFLQEEELSRYYVEKVANSTLDLGDEIKEMEFIFSKILDKAVEVDPTLKKSVLAENQNQTNSFRRLESRIHKARKENMIRL